MKMKGRKQTMVEKSKNYIISGEAFWASLVQPNTKYVPSWQVDVGNLDDNTAKMLKDLDLNVRKCDKQEHNRGMFITLKRNVAYQSGEQKSPPIVKDSQNNPWNGMLIGNGSKINAKFHVYTNSYGTFAELDAVQVVKLVEYARSDFDTVEGGYTVSNESNDLEEIAL